MKQIITLLLLFSLSILCAVGLEQYQATGNGLSAKLQQIQEQPMVLQPANIDEGDTSAQTATIMKTYALHEKDTGSSDVQIAVLTERINQLSGHLKAHNHDQNTRRSLLKIIGRRRRLLAYLSREDINRYRDLIGKLGLRK